MKLVHDVNDMRASQMMLELQKCKEFPVEITNGTDTMIIKNEHDASMVSVGMLFAIEMKLKEEDEVIF